MNRLPDTSDIPDEIVLLRRHRNDYDHALRVAGARLVEVGFHDWTFEYELERAIGPETAAVFYMGHDGHANIRVERAVEIAHAHEVPVIIDASVALPPASNLRRFIDIGADLVSFSGGKHLQGPQASGMLAGRRDLITSVALQHQDMDVYPATWPARELMADGVVSGPPHHGLGRGFKVGKEEIAGLVAALQLYLERDFEAERIRLSGYADEMSAALSGRVGFRAEVLDLRVMGRPGPHVELHVDETAAGLSAIDLVNRLQEHDPIVCIFEGKAGFGEVGLYPDAFDEGEAAEVVAAIDDIVAFS